MYSNPFENYYVKLNNDLFLCYSPTDGSPRNFNRHSLDLECTLSEEDQETTLDVTRPGSRGKKESNRDSGIGSMTLSEQLKQELDDR